MRGRRGRRGEGEGEEGGERRGREGRRVEGRKRGGGQWIMVWQLSLFLHIHYKLELTNMTNHTIVHQIHLLGKLAACQLHFS